MNLVPLKKEEIKTLETETQRIEYYFNNMKDNFYEKCIQYIMGIQCWHDTHNLSVNDSQKKQNDKLSELFKIKPAYYVTYECKNAVWGFNFEINEKYNENNKVIIYHDKRGLSIQVHPKFRKDKIIDLLQLLFNVLVNKDNISETLKLVLKDIL